MSTTVALQINRTTSPISFDRDRFGQCLENIAAPTLVVQGERGMRTLDDAERFALLSNAKREQVAGAGHMLHWSHSDEIAALLREHVGARAV